MSAISMFTKNIVEVNYNTLPTDVVAATKKQILDTLGVAVAGSMSENIRQVVDLVKDWGGKEESTILGYGGKVPCTNAALVNGWSAAVLDFDDFHDVDFIHTSREVVPATLAIAERKGIINGKDFIVALVLGTDIAYRMARAALVHRETGFLTVPNFFGVAAAAGKILGLDEDKLRNALGIALMQVSGEGYGIREGLNSKGLDNGLQGRAGILAALMAEKGISGSVDPIEGEGFGFYALYHRNLYTPALLTEDLGKVFENVNVSQKPYPCCRFNHSSVSAALFLVNKYDIKPNDVAEVMVHHGPIAHSLFEPIERKRKPRNAIQTQHSLPWAVASAIVHRKVEIEQFTEEAIRDARVLDMAQKVVPKMAPEFAQIPVAEPAIVEIKTNNGEVYSKRVDIAPGDPKSPMSFDDIVKKFRYCCSYPAKSVSKENQDKVVQMIERLEDVTDVGQIASLLG
ncbi:MmgE/PrpD family protein [Chloroflexota bacterium]